MARLSRPRCLHARLLSIRRTQFAARAARLSQGCC
jgi:hypothetical protein